MLEQIIERLYEFPPDKLDREDAHEAVEQLKQSLNLGEARSAEQYNGVWQVNSWVKKGILLAFRIGQLTEHSANSEGMPTHHHAQFFDKDTLPLKDLDVKNNVRIVPGGSAIRDG